jgi:hypothetical protein
MLYRVVWQTFTDVSEVLAASIVRTDLRLHQTTRCNIQEDSNLHSGRRENLKYHQILHNWHISVLYCNGLKRCG